MKKQIKKSMKKEYILGKFFALPKTISGKEKGKGEKEKGEAYLVEMALCCFRHYDYLYYLNGW